MWLSFDEGDVGLSLDFTGFVAGLKVAEKAMERFEERRRTRRALQTMEDFQATMDRTQEILAMTPDELLEMQRDVLALAEEIDEP